MLQREREQKVIPNIIEPLTRELPRAMHDQIHRNAYGFSEQCMRLVAHCVDEPIQFDTIDNRSINEKYEKHIETFLPEHPFIKGKNFRNAVFESLALVMLITSSDPRCSELIRKYANRSKRSYHLVYLLHATTEQGDVPIEYLRIVMESALEFESTSTAIELRVEGPEPIEPASSQKDDQPVEVEILVGPELDVTRGFSFYTRVNPATKVNLGPRLSSTYIMLPCEVILSGNDEIELTAPVEISASKLTLDGQELVLRSSYRDQLPRQIILEANDLATSLQSISSNNIDLAISIPPDITCTYPCVQYLQTKEPIQRDPML